MLRPFPVLLRLMSLAIEWQAEFSTARQGAANTLLHLGKPRSFRAAQVQGRGPSSSPIGISITKVARLLGLERNHDLRSATSTWDSLVRISTLNATQPAGQPSTSPPHNSVWSA